MIAPRDCTVAGLTSWRTAALCIREFTTPVLIDPDGRVVKGSAEHKLKRALDDLREQKLGKAGAE